MIDKVLKYDPVSGTLTWLPGTHRSGQTAGGINSRLGYIQLTHKGKTYYAHRIAWFLTHGYWPKHIDHIDGDKTNNSLDNLREVEQQENHRNMKLFSNSTSGITGVRQHSQTGRWGAFITVDGQDISLGWFDTIEAAAAARKAADAEYGFHPNHGREVAA